MVVIGSTGDSATPYEYAVDMAEELESAVLVTRRGAGHTAYDKSPCIARLVQGFLTQGRVPRDGTTC
jgi:predicted alpha/beta hydrolase family esterase